MFPAKDRLTLCFAHVSYQFQARFSVRGAGIASFEVRSSADLQRRLPDADVLVVSGLWDNRLVDGAPRLKFIQSASAGVDQYDRQLLTAKNIRLASAQGVNADAVAQHAIALMLAFARRLPEARDNQAKRVWRGMISDFARREDEVGGKTLVIVGLGRIGGRLAQLAKAFGMRVIGVRRDPTAGANGADAVVGLDALSSVLPEADVVALTCPLTPQTEKVIDAKAFARMKPSALLINVARGRCVDEAALIAALQERRIAGAGIDVTAEEPLAPSSPLWGFENVLITPHVAGETCRYEDNVLDVLMENLGRLRRGEQTLLNQIV
jgi:phosphoglycerate dehydrogenase-like enzyme